MKRELLSVFLFLPLFLLAPSTSGASLFSDLVVFGDSLSDNGIGIDDPFGIMRFTDGPIWVETLANGLNAKLYDAAYVGATTGWDNPAAGSADLGLQWQLANTLPFYLPQIDIANTLFTVWAGANDFLQSRNLFTAVSNIGIALNDLYTFGARDILVGNLPDLGATPAMITAGMSSPASAWTSAFNLTLETALSAFQATHADANLHLLNVYDIFSEFSVGTPEWLQLFWVDGFHPSAVGHQLITDAAYIEVVPVPTTMLLLSFGLLGLAGVGRRKE